MKQTILMMFLMLFLVTPVTSEARYRSVDRDKLDDEIVETFPIPILFGVEYDDLVPDFKDPRDNGDRSHEGQDMRAPLGTPIVSPTKAIVTRIGKGDSAGNYVYTANPGGETFRYMHLDQVATNLDEGDELDEGDFIGTVGDTGNAPDGVYHLHLETRDDKNEAQDPYERLAEEGWTLREKITFLSDVFKGIKDDDEYAEMLVDNFRTEFTEALNKGYNLPNEVEDVLDDRGIVSQEEKLERLESAFKTLPQLLRRDLGNGEQGIEVVILQLYLIYMSEGTASDDLRAAGPTGYYGTITEAAVLEYQKNNYIDNTGVLDQKTRADMQENSSAKLRLI